MGVPSVRERADIPWHSRPAQIVLVSTLTLPLGVPLLSPFLPLVRDAFALTDIQASYLLSIYFLPGIVLSPVIGRVINQAGRRPVLIVSLVVFGSVGTSIVFYTGYPVILAARFVQGIAAAGIFITTVTVIADSFGGLQRNVIFGINVAALSAGRALYPLVGGSLALYGWNIPFVCYLAAILVGVFVFLTFEESAQPRWSAHHVTVRQTIGKLATGQTLLLYGATFLAEVVVFGAIMTTLPFLLAADYGVSVVVIGTTLTATTIASALFAANNGRLARQFSNQELVAAGFLCYGLSLIGIGMAPSLVVIALLVLVFGVGIGLILPSVDAAISKAISAEFHASALSLRNSTTGLGRATGPLLFTTTASVTGYRGLFLTAGTITLVISLSGVVMTRGLSD